MEMKKLLTKFVVTFFVATSTTIPVSADIMSNATSSLNQDIISNVISQTKLESNSESNENFEMIEIGTGSDTQTLLESDDVSYALQSKNIHPDNTISVKTVFPYKVTEDGEMINSFEYASLRASSNETTKFVDVTVTVIASYASYPCADFARVYRHAGVEAYWNSSNSTTTVSNLSVRYETQGDLYAYPDVVNQGVISSTKLQSNYFIRSQINKANPVKNQNYMDGNHTMPYDRVVYCSDYFSHGGLVYLQCTYKTNGTTRTDDRSYDVYGK